MSEPYIGQLMIVGFGFAPRGWAQCNGQMLPIAQNTALYSLLGTTYGGDGKSLFALPDLRGRVPIHAGQGLKLSNYKRGQAGGEERHSLSNSEMPAHNHLVFTTNVSGAMGTPHGNFLAASSDESTASMYRPNRDGTNLNPGSISVAGESSPHNNMPPFLAMIFCIAVEGVLPLRY